ncbi:hypothetical protein MMC09_003532 [Bachmanniomyces sp. S44760]|nr:hypothetical protein [Bachmanniomyces sp. S44760]
MAALSNNLNGLTSTLVNLKYGQGDQIIPPVPNSGNSSVYYLLSTSLLLPLIFPLYTYVLKDYHAYLSLGPGGTPSTFPGYLKVTFLSMVFAISDPYTAPCLSPYEHPCTGYLNNLPERTGPRPVVKGIAPHRQLTQKGSKLMYETLASSLKALATANSDFLHTGVSFFEKHGLALFFGPKRDQSPSHISSTGATSMATACRGPPTPAANQQITLPKTVPHTEIVHLHGTEASMHMTLHPSDAALVISRGWGERHLLAGQGLFGRWLWVPRGFVLVYAPRSEEDVETLMKIVKAAGWWIGGRELHDRYGKAGIETLEL